MEENSYFLYRALNLSEEFRKPRVYPETSASNIKKTAKMFTGDSEVKKKMEFAKIINLKKVDIILYSILVFAFVIRLVGLNFGLPYLYAPCELHTVNPVIKILVKGDFNPHWFLWPGSFVMYVLAFILAVILTTYFIYCFLFGSVHNLVEFKYLIKNNPLFYYADNPVFFHFVGRILMVLFAVITIYLVYLIAKRLFNQSVGLLAAFCLSISSLHIEYSRFIRPDVPVTMLIMLSFYLLLRFIEENKNIKWLILASLSAGFSIASKYVSGVIIFPILIYCLISDSQENRMLSAGYLIKSLKLKINFSKALLFIFIGFFTFAPFVILDYQRAVEDMIYVSRYVELGAERLPGIQTHLWYLRNTAQSGIGGLFFVTFVILGLGSMFFKKSYKSYLFLLFPIVYFLIIGCLRFMVSRYWIIVLPFEAIIFGVGFYGSYKFFIQKKAFQAHKSKILSLFAIMFIIASLPVVRTGVRGGIKLTRKDTRTMAKEWIESNLPRGAKIVDETFPNLQIKPSSNFILMSDPEDKGIVSRPLSYYKESSVDYIIITDRFRKKFYAKPDIYPEEISRYEELKGKIKAIKRFGNKRNPGPTIEIYKLR